jgi:predicted NBD/HSP70 family sugar kinase
MTNGSADDKGNGKAALGGDRLPRNYRKTLEALGWSTGMTRSALALELGMPKGTVAGIVDHLVERGLVVEEVPRVRPLRPGRPAKVLALAGRSPMAGAIVLSGGLLTAAAVSYAGQILGRAVRPMSTQEANTAVTGPGIALLEQALAQAGLGTGELNVAVLGVPAPFQPGVGLPEPLGSDKRERVRGDLPSFVPWLSAGFTDELAGRLGVPTLVENDANLGALGESVFGAGRGVDSFVYVKLVRRVGAGVVVAGRLHRGATGFAGELGHVHVRDDGPLCACGGRGCLSGLLGEALVQVVQPAYERPLTFRDVLELAAGGEAGPRRVLEDLGRTIGRPLADFVTLFNPGAIVVDGSLGQAASYVMGGISEMVERFAAPTAADAVSVVAGELGDDADLLGAAALGRSVPG